MNIPNAIRRCVAGSLICTGLFLTGCRFQTGPSMYPVTGSVEFDGKPVEDGDILFYPEEKELAPDAGKIVNGQYKLQAKEGRKTVQIRATRVVPGKTQPHPSGGTMEVREDYIPERYNTKTELTAEITAGSDNGVDFTLTSEK